MKPKPRAFVKRVTDNGSNVKGRSLALKRTWLSRRQKRGAGRRDRKSEVVWPFDGRQSSTYEERNNEGSPSHIRTLLTAAGRGSKRAPCRVGAAGAPGEQDHGVEAFAGRLVIAG